MKFIIDECLSHHLVSHLVARGYPDSIHPIHVGLLGARDDQIVARAFAEERVIITANRRDYRKLLSQMQLHPGAIIVEALVREATWRQILGALAFLEMQPQPEDYMINRVVEVSTSGGVRPFELSSDSSAPT